MTTPFIPSGYTQIQKQLQAEKQGGYWGGYYKPNVHGMTPTQKKSFSGRILPIFDYTLSQADADFSTSWAPYRNVDNINQETGQPELSAFFAVVAAYSWFGNKQVSFLSPSTLRFTQGITSGPELIDPVQDLRNYAKKHADPAVRALTERPENNKESRVVLPYANKRYVFNVFGTSGTDRVVKNYALDVAQKSFEDLAAKLSEWRPAHERIIDPAWDGYLYGDITNPNTGVLVDTVSLPATPQPFNGFVFTSGSHKSLNGIRQLPVSEEALRGRYHFYGENSVFKIFSAQEIVDFLVEDGAIPYNLIQEVCSHYCNVPPQPKQRTMVSAGQDEIEGFQSSYVPPMPMAKPLPAPVRQVAPVAQPLPPTSAYPTAPVAPVAPVRPVAPTAPSAPAPRPTPPAPVQKEAAYWVSVNGGTSELLTESAARSMVLGPNGHSMLLLNEEPGSVWSTPVELGFLPKAGPKPPVAPSPAPVPFSPPVASVSTPPKVNTKPPAGDADPLTPEEKAELDELQRMFTSGGDAMSSQTPGTMDNLTRFTVLLDRHERSSK